MFFIFSQVLNIIFDFYNLIIFLILSAFLISFFNKKISTIIYLVSIIIFIITSILPTGSYLMKYLENNNYDIENIPKNIDGIIVLSGSIQPKLTFDYKDVQFNNSSERIFKFIELSKKFPNAKKVFSGGNAFFFDKKLNQSYFAKNLLSKFELNNIIYEDKSKNTYENIAFSYKKLNPKNNENWILISSAYHIKRVKHVLDKYNWKVYFYPVDYRIEKKIVWYKNIKPFKNLVRFNEAFRELLGIFVYKYFLI